MKTFRLLGKPVAHSLSPLLYSVAFHELEVEATYEAIEVEPEDLRQRLSAPGAGGNVTIPHKQEAAALVDHASADVTVTGACNCFWRGEDGSLIGDNTDVEGFRRAAKDIHGLFLQSADVLLIGAGGAAAAVTQACVLSGAARVHLVNRSPERSRALAGQFAGQDTEVRPVPHGDLMGAHYDLVVNATSLGLWLGDPLPIDLSRIKADVAMDLVYGPGGTAWTRHARIEGIVSVDGLTMLVHQAALSVENWFGTAPSTEAMLYTARLKMGWAW